MLITSLFHPISPPPSFSNCIFKPILKASTNLSYHSSPISKEKSSVAVQLCCEVIHLKSFRNGGENRNWPMAFSCFYLPKFQISSINNNIPWLHSRESGIIFDENFALFFYIWGTAVCLVLDVPSAAGRAPRKVTFCFLHPKNFVSLQTPMNEWMNEVFYITSSNACGQTACLRLRRLYKVADGDNFKYSSLCSKLSHSATVKTRQGQNRMNKCIF